MVSWVDITEQDIQCGVVGWKVPAVLWQGLGLSGRMHGGMVSSLLTP
jgi:hypothetical protein